MSAAGDIEVRIASLHVHPVKSCAGIAVDEAKIETYRVKD